MTKPNTQTQRSLRFKSTLSAIAVACCFGFSVPQAEAQTGDAIVSKPAAAYSSGVVYDWFSLAFQLIQQTPGFSPPVAARAMGYMGLSLYESVVPGMPGYQSLAGQLNDLSSLPWAQPDEPLHWPTVANASLATMVRMMFPTASAENKARIDVLERSLPILNLFNFYNSTILRLSLPIAFGVRI